MFGSKKKWDFVYEGNRIEAKVTDEEFLKRVEKREPFAHGDALEVEIEIKQKYNEEIGVFINDSYVVSKVVRHISKTEQKPLFGNEDEA